MFNLKNFPCSFDGLRFVGLLCCFAALNTAPFACVQLDDATWFIRHAIHFGYDTDPRVVSILALSRLVGGTKSILGPLPTLNPVSTAVQRILLSHRLLSCRFGECLGLVVYFLPSITLFSRREMKTKKAKKK